MSEVRITDELRLDAPIGVVWRAIEDPAVHARWHPFVSAIEGGHELHEIRSCSVRVGKKEGATKERCVEREDGARIAWAVEDDSTGFGRMVSGWCSGFSLAERDGATIVAAHSAFRPNMFVRAMLPVIRRKFHQTQQAILRGLQEAVEGDRAARAA
ncbi:MAG TPA: SRPBCC family protein [Solirubrobacteraceae bacterium]|nr:SRPBCC family protein [Solirubrobacteraceae bacterium]